MSPIINDRGRNTDWLSPSVIAFLCGRHVRAETYVSMED